jgi:hypothetical protein
MKVDRVAFPSETAGGKKNSRYRGSILGTEIDDDEGTKQVGSSSPLRSPESGQIVELSANLRAMTP